MTSFRYNGVYHKPRGSFIFLSGGGLPAPKTNEKAKENAGRGTPSCEKYAQKVIDRAYFIILDRIDEPEGTNKRRIEYDQKHIEKCIKL